MNSPEIDDAEMQVLRLLADGLKDKEIARSLNMSRRTVEGIASRLRDKLGASTRTGAAVRAIRIGVIE